jgi:hypothetical protein
VGWVFKILVINIHFIQVRVANIFKYLALPSEETQEGEAMETYRH